MKIKLIYKSQVAFYNIYSFIFIVFLKLILVYLIKKMTIYIGQLII